MKLSEALGSEAVSRRRVLVILGVAVAGLGLPVLFLAILVIGVPDWVGWILDVIFGSWHF